MENDNISPTPVDIVPGKKPGIIEKIFKVFYQPSAVFGHLTGKIEWLVPIIIIALFGSTLGHLIRPIFVADQEKAIMERMEQYRDQIPTERYNQMMADMEERFAEAKSNKYLWYTPLVAVVFPLVLFLIIAVICMVIGNFAFGGKCGFWIVMNVVAFAALIGLLGDTVRELLMLSKGTSNVFTGLGILTPINDGSFVHYLFKQVDLFSIWRIIVTSIGLGIIYKMKPQKFAYVLFSIWIVFIVLVALGNSTIFMGGIIY